MTSYLKYKKQLNLLRITILLCKKHNHCCVFFCSFDSKYRTAGHLYNRSHKIILKKNTHTDLRGKQARIQVLKYYNRDNSKEVKGTDNCDEEQTQQTRSRTALTHKGPSSRLFRRRFRKRLQ